MFLIFLIRGGWRRKPHIWGQTLMWWLCLACLDQLGFARSSGSCWESMIHDAYKDAGQLPVTLRTWQIASAAARSLKWNEPPRGQSQVKSVIGRWPWLFPLMARGGRGLRHANMNAPLKVWLGSPKCLCEEMWRGLHVRCFKPAEYVLSTILHFIFEDYKPLHLGISAMGLLPWTL